MPQLGRPPSKRCEKSYDTLRLNTSVPSCGLLGSHDDFSVVADSLPRDTAVVTQLRCGQCADLYSSAPLPNSSPSGVYTWCDDDCHRGPDRLTFHAQPAQRRIGVAQKLPVECGEPTPNKICVFGRDPVDRLLSAYEFALEVAVRGLRPNRRPPDPKKVPHALLAPPRTLLLRCRATPAY